MHKLMFLAGVKGMSEQSELMPCIKEYYIFLHCVVFIVMNEYIALYI